ncbi:MAG: protein-export membrane protein SecD [Micrococcales bacterium 73-15]|uniref:protein translocase subunit SecD n=1 Tax=Salana multivorans TaxID=120377 RepID=UPI000960C787|nr:protein translocase subunit SecD [Salana multivorans]OJX94385.1 MAG: protein-export membrane protein SecD [Micrococcales bacterium 73-15]
MARRRRLARPLYFLALILVAVYAAVGIGVVTGDDDAAGGASFTPNLALDLEGGTQLILTPRTDDGHAVTQSDLDQAIAIIRQRVDGSGVAEAEITSQGGNNIVVAIPGEVSEDTVQLITASAQMRMRTVLVEGLPGTIDPAAVAQGTDDATDGTDGTPDEATDGSTDGATDTPTDGATDGATDEATAPTDEPSDGATDTPTEASTEPSTTLTVEQAALQVLGVASVDELSDTPATEPTSPSDLAWLTPRVLFDYYTLDCYDPANRTGLQDDDTEAPLVTCSQDGAAKYVLGPAELTGQDLTGAQMGFQSLQGGGVTNIPIVQMNFTNAGGQKFAEVTARIKELAQPQNQFAIVLDGLVISAPRVTETIPNGQATISGPTQSPFTRDEATTLANQLSFGALPMTFEVQSQEQISATLGGEQLERGLLAGVIGLILVVIYSFLQYRGLAVVTVASLAIAAALTYGVILLLSWTQGYRLSLAGVAGLIVAIGITADSFIVYFERLRDEVREGRSLAGAVEHGWLRARRTILASDAVNFIAAIVLYLLAVGGVRGFAFTLGLTTLIDLVVVFLFTHPLMRLLIKIPFFGEGHRWSGLDPVHLGASVASYAGRGRVRSAPEKVAVAANADVRTIAERRAEEARLAKEAAERESAEAAEAELAGELPVAAIDPSETATDAIDGEIAAHSPIAEAAAEGVVLAPEDSADQNEDVDETGGDDATASERNEEAR